MSEEGGRALWFLSVSFSESFFVHGLAGMRLPEPHCEGTLSMAPACGSLRSVS